MRAPFHILVHSKYQSSGRFVRFLYLLTVVLTCFNAPRSTCFNRIDLPDYKSKKLLLERLKAAVTLSHVGFGIE